LPLAPARHRARTASRLLAGPGFLNAGAYREISFRSELLAWIPAEWRAAGRLQVKNAEHELACHLICTLAARGRTAPRASLSPAAGSWIPGG
jgi:hypothetical protein